MELSKAWELVLDEATRSLDEIDPEDKDTRLWLKDLKEAVDLLIEKYATDIRKE
ncbi:hypothetical protein KAR91_66825 [Candidatus Pacearchaeota archaeon]|nr:hypothetical protein [Candidatus Pacearchaeota archaeon]